MIFKADFSKPCSWIQDHQFFEPRLTDDVIQWFNDLEIEYDFQVVYEEISDFFSTNESPETKVKILACYIYIEDIRKATLFKLTWL
jgi:hypothetical protein